MPTTLPESTYRLQLHAGLTLADAAERVVPYLAALGVTHAYTSPCLRSRPGSTHGYDVVDHASINPELGGAAAHRAFVAALRRLGMGHILDVVPNHAGVATDDNAWWNDVLEHGPASRFAGFFDISWHASPRPELHDRVLLPLLGSPYAAALEKGELKLDMDASGAMAVHYHDRRFPLDPATYAHVLRPAARDAPELSGIVEACEALPHRSSRHPGIAEQRHAQGQAIKARLAEVMARGGGRERDAILASIARLNGRPGEPRSFDALDALLCDQAYRLAHWRIAGEEINYRRFFDINDLAALSMERQDVFAATHALVLGLIDEGLLDGLRIDHPDGLLDPEAYFQRLQAAVAPARRPLYVVAEKILAPHEPLPESWAVNGTTGYEFLNEVNGLFVDPAGEAPLTQLYAELTACAEPFDEVAYRAKLLVLDASFPGDLQVLAHRFDRLARRHRRWREFTQAGIREALREAIACFPVYRTYVTERGPGERDRAVIAEALGRARRRAPRLDAALFGFVEDVLLLRVPEPLGDDARAEMVRLAGKLQQLTAPVAAKGVEDTAFYRYHRLVSLNEVGGEPGRFGVSPGELHAFLAERQRRWPHALSALATHDTKRGEDVRARLNVLSELPDEWAERVRRWFALNAPHRRGPGPDANDEYLLYQTLLSAWPSPPSPLAGEGWGGGEPRHAEEPPSAEQPGHTFAPSPLADPETTDPPPLPDDFLPRIQAYMTKSLRESKRHTTWTDPDAAYEQSTSDFVAAILDPANRAFLDDFAPFQRRVARAGLFNTLAQTLLRLAAPGVPDTYQGTELLDLSLVDPDNRRPVDYALRQRLLDELTARAESDRAALARALAEHPGDGRIKLYVTAETLRLRRRLPGLFTSGEYLPIEPTGPGAGHLFAFARRHGGAAAIVVVARLLVRSGSPADAVADTALPLPPEAGRFRSLRHAFTGRDVEPRRRGDARALAADDLLAEFPVALLIAGV